MLIDKGFSHAIARAVLEDTPDNQAAKDILNQPNNKIILDSGTIIDFDEKAISNGFKEKMSRYTAGA